MIKVALYLDARREACVRILPSFSCRQDEFWTEVHTACRHIGKKGGAFIDVLEFSEHASAKAMVAHYVSEGYYDMTGKPPFSN